MNQAILVAIIGAAGAIIGTILTLTGTTITARQKIKEIELTHRQALEDKYLVNARLHINTVYMPININLSKLERRFYDFKTFINTHEEQSEEYHQALQEFREVCADFVNQITKLVNEGMDVYLTDKLDQRLRLFTDFVRNSKDTDTFSVTGKVRLLTFETSAPYKLEADRRREARWLRYIDLYISMQRVFNNLFRLTNPLHILYKQPFSEVNIEILAAPITSISFDLRISRDIPDFKSFIREVTLGTVSEI